MARLHNPPAFPRALSSLTTCQVLMLNQTSGVTHKRCTPPVVRASTQGDAVVLCKQGRTARREFLEVVAVLTTSAFLTDTSLAEKTPKGYQAVLDKFDGYTFLYPFGWQEVVVNGQDKTYKDVIEPLESVSVSIVPTSKTDIHELGPPEERTAEGKNYYTFEFVAKAPNYTRHALGTVAIGNGKFYTLTTGANERRWSKMENKLRTVAESLTLFNV